MIAYAVEKLDQWQPDIQPLIVRHWEEVAVHRDIPLDVDWEWYRSAEHLGMLATYTARMNGELIGYAIFFFRPSHPHYKSMGWAKNDVIFVTPKHRRDGVGDGLLDIAERDLKDRGAMVVIVDSKTSHPALAMMLLRRGYNHTEDAYSLRV